MAASNNNAVPPVRQARTSIHTPLKPASVQDLKARFDPSKGDQGGGADPHLTPTSTTSSIVSVVSRAVSPHSDRRDAAGLLELKETSNTLPSGKSTLVTLSSVSTSLQAAAHRKLGSSSVSVSSSNSNVSASSSSIVQSSNLRPLPKSSITLITPRPFSPPSSQSSSKPGSANSSGRNSPTQESCAKVVPSSLAAAIGIFEPKQLTKPTWNTTLHNSSHAKSNDPSYSSDIQSIFQKDKDGRLELPVMHITNSGSDTSIEVRPRGPVPDSRIRPSHERKNIKGCISSVSKNSGSKFPSTADSVAKPETLISNSPPVQRTRKLVAREIKIERLESGVNVTSYKDPDPTEVAKQPESIKSSGNCEAGVKVREIKVERVFTDPVLQATATSIQPKNPSEEPEFIKVKLRKIRPESIEEGSSTALVAEVPMKDTTDPNDKRLSRKMSSERFERLMFDFQRGVAPESILRRCSETDHIVLQQKARELSQPVIEEEVPIIARKKKEPSIFTEGLKVSDFVKQVNKMNPEVDGPPKWRVQRAQSQTSSVSSSDVGGDNFYQGIPGEDIGTISDEDDIYEQVVQKGEGSHELDKKAKERQLAIYRKTRGSGRQRIRAPSTKYVDDGDEKVIHSDGEGGWEQSDLSSSGTEYEDIGQDGDDLESFYEDLENLSNPKRDLAKSQSLGHKFKNIFKSGDKQKGNKLQTDSGVSAGTDSDVDALDDVDEVDNDLIETLSRTSSERSSGHLTRDSVTLSSISTTTSIATTASNMEDLPVTSSVAAVNLTAPAPVMSAANAPALPPPPLPPRTVKVLSQTAEKSPALPPRNSALTNKNSLGVPLDTVVPISPSSRSGGLPYSNKSKDRFSFSGASTQDGPDTARIEYIDYDPASPGTLERLERSDRKSGNSRPSSSVSSSSSSVYSTAAYLYPDMTVFHQLKGDISDDKLYVDLEDEQIYGKKSGIYVSKFESEPLYQWYSKDKVLQSLRSDKSTSDDISSDDEYLEDRKHSDSVYEDVEKLLEKNYSSAARVSVAVGGKQTDSRTSTHLSANGKDKPQRRSVIEDVFKNGGNLHRALWCQMPEVIESGLLDKLSDQEKKVQEAMFEIITSEASYLKSLKILISVFLMAPEFSNEMSGNCVISRRDRQVLFSNIGSIKDISEGFLKDLEQRWQESVYMKDICDIIYKHASNHFEPYVRYCGNQAFQDRILNELRQKSDFDDAVKRLEQHPNCQFLPLSSFLLLPMQRITRLPLLVDAIARRLDPNSPVQASVKRAMDSLTRVAKRCDDAAKKMQQTEQMCVLAANIEFKIKEFPLISASRFLVKQGELTLIKSEGTSRKAFSKLLGTNKEHVYLFLFNDIILVTKKKGTTYQVRDYCQRNALHLEVVDNADKSRSIGLGALGNVSNVLFLAMLSNHEGKQVEFVLTCKSESERTRWLEAILPPQTSDSERIYDYWDCPQFHCVKTYIAQQPDELTLEESDVINVTRKMADGWYEGERIRDGSRGWFPASHTEEINNSHVRARNLRLRYRLMRASQDISSHKK